DPGPIFKFGRRDAVHEADLTADRTGTAAGKPQCVVHFFGVVDDHKKEWIFFRQTSAPKQLSRA
ncbi:MAG: hypothetical protein VX120_03045, partial [Pseudomonadota bacterium]|nr:hypothetical protein [Pseudomonadota bacterium]